MTTFIVIYIMVLHWLADFVFQSDEMAQNKSTSWEWLAAHILTYSEILFFGLAILALFQIPQEFRLRSDLNTVFQTYPYYLKNIAVYTILNGALHFGIDAVTSRINSYFWKQGKVHEFFVCVGLDQLLHFICLYGTLVLWQG